MAEVSEIIGQDGTVASPVIEPWSFFKPFTQVVPAEHGTRDGEFLGRWEFNDDIDIWGFCNFVDEVRGLLVFKEGTQPVFEGPVIDLTVILDYVGRFQDHDPLGVVWVLVGGSTLTHGV